MWYAGVDMGWQTTVIALVSDAGQWVSPRRFTNEHPLAIVEFIHKNGPFRAVIEAIGSYRWLYDLLSEYGEVVLAHPYRLRAIWSGRAKTDKLDARVLAELLRGALIPRAYVPPPEYQVLRDITRARARLTQARTRVINELRAIFARGNIRAPFKYPFGPRGTRLD